jgi:hypothetical protein
MYRLILVIVWLIVWVIRPVQAQKAILAKVQKPVSRDKSWHFFNTTEGQKWAYERWYNLFWEFDQSFRKGTLGSNMTIHAQLKPGYKGWNQVPTPLLREFLREYSLSTQSGSPKAHPKAQG